MATTDIRLTRVTTSHGLPGIRISAEREVGGMTHSDVIELVESDVDFSLKARRDYKVMRDASFRWAERARESY